MLITIAYDLFNHYGDMVHFGIYIQLKALRHNKDSLDNFICTICPKIASINIVKLDKDKSGTRFELKTPGSQSKALTA